MYKRYKEFISGNTAIIPYGETIIVDEAFKDCTYLEKVVIPNSVAEIRFGAFAGCTALEDIEIPNSVERILDRAFEGCTALKQLLIPASVTEIGLIGFPGGVDNPFRGCDNLTELIISKDNPDYSSAGNCVLSKDGTYLYFGIKNSVIPESVKTICDDSFRDVKIETLEIPNSVEYIGNYAFCGCPLKSIEIPNSVKQIGVTAFWGSCLSHIEIPESVIEFCYPDKDDECFLLDNMTSVVVAKKNPMFMSEGNCILSKDGTKLLFGCKHSVIPPTVVTIDSFAFSGSKIDSIDIPESVRVIEWGAFNDCFNLKTIKIHNPNPEELEMEDAFSCGCGRSVYDDFVEISTISLEVPIGCGYAYRHHPFFKGFKEILPRL